VVSRLRRPQVAALAWAAGVNSLCALLFWIVATVVGSPTFLSFWNRTLPGKLGLTALFVVLGGRALIWYARKLYTYGARNERGPYRLTPLGFGLGVFSITVAWLGVTMISESAYRAVRLLITPQDYDFTLLLLPLISFVQFVFSRSTLLWLLAGGVVWQLAARLLDSRSVLLAYYGRTRHTDDVTLGTSLSFVRTWNVVGYMVFILSLLFQS